MTDQQSERFDPILARIMGDADAGAGTAIQEVLHPSQISDVQSFEELVAEMSIVFSSSAKSKPNPVLRSRVMDAVGTRAPSVVTAAFGYSAAEIESAAVVVTGLDKFVRWVSPAFCEMCGYSTAELHGRRLGPILQGPLTDPHAVEVIRQAVRRFEPVTQELVNYDKSGDPYWVHLAIRTSFAPDGVPLAYVAIERKLSRQV